MAASRHTRFEVFKRDGFTCQYCGQTPPAVLLELDHLIPIHPSNGEPPGTDAEDNLITSCQDCNRGKSNVPLGTVRPDIAEKLEHLKEREDQLKAYQSVLRRKERRVAKDCQEVNTVYSDAYPEWELSDRFVRGSLRKFLSLLPKQDVIESMNIAISRFPGDSDRCIPYFCGICWKKIKG